jgi:hypothetical protein
VEKYKLPKKLLEAEEAKGAPDVSAGHAYRDADLKNKFSIHHGQDLFSPVHHHDEFTEIEDEIESRSSHGKKRKRKERHKKKKDKRRKHGRKYEKGRVESSSDRSDNSHERHRKKRSRSDDKRRKDETDHRMAAIEND